LIASLESPLLGRFQLRLNMPLAAAPGERVQVPDLRLLDASAVESFVALPSLVDQQQISWETRGLQTAEVTSSLRDFAPSGAQLFQVTGSRFQASIKRLEGAASVPQVRLADVRMIHADDGSWLGVASFDLEPAGLSHCQLQMPEGYELLQATVADQAAVGMRSDSTATRWRLMLHHNQLLSTLKCCSARRAMRVIQPAKSGSFAPRNWPMCPSSARSGR
jgi:hypothetical protein